MSTIDHGLEVLRKSSEQYLSQNHESILRVKDPVTHSKLDAIASALGGGVGSILNLYSLDQIVPSATTSEIYSYTVPVGKKLALNFINLNGENIAKYLVKVDAVTIASARTYFGGGLESTLSFGSYLILAGEELTIDVVNFRTSASNFTSRIVGELLDA